jgi:hypothetical protein
MRAVFAGEVHVSHGFIFVQPREESPDMLAAPAGQTNGLCGAATPGALSLVTGLHTGAVPLTVELHDSAPSAAVHWEEIVEVSFVTAVAELALATFDDFVELSLPMSGSFRVRYCASGMDAAHDLTRLRDDPPLDRYLLQLWPAAPADDAIIRQTSAIAAHWHRTAQGQPPPTPPAAEEPDQATRIESEREAALARARQRAAHSGDRRLATLRQRAVKSDRQSLASRPEIRHAPDQRPANYSG